MSYQNNDKPHLLSTSMNITEACTLNCKLCFKDELLETFCKCSKMKVIHM